MGAIAPGSWLPALPDGSSLGPRPAALHQRYVDLNQKFADAWRVTQKTSLFDYAPGTSTDTFTLPEWPKESPPCDLPEGKPAKPMDPRRAAALCREVADKERRANCVFDVRVTGEPGFARLYLISQRIQAGGTTTTVGAGKVGLRGQEEVTFTAVVTRKVGAVRSVPLTGTVQFLVDGERAGEPVKLTGGRATWTTARLRPGRHSVAALYTPVKGSPFLASRSLDVLVTVEK